MCIKTRHQTTKNTATPTVETFTRLALVKQTRVITYLKHATNQLQLYSLSGAKHFHTHDFIKGLRTCWL